METLDLKHLPEDHPDAPALALGLGGTRFPYLVWTRAHRACWYGQCGSTTVVIQATPWNGPTGPHVTVVCDGCGRGAHLYKNQKLRVSTVFQKLEEYARVVSHMRKAGRDPATLFDPQV